MTVIVVVIDESKDSLIKRRAVFLRLDVNIVISYRSPKSFYPDVVLCPAPAVHTDLHFRMLGARFLPIQAGASSDRWPGRPSAASGGEFAKCLAFFQGLYGHLRLKLGVILLSAFLHGAKLLLFRHLS